MSSSISLPVRILPALLYCVAALRVDHVVNNGHGAGSASNITKHYANITWTKQDEYQENSLPPSPTIHDESVATPQDFVMQSDDAQSALASSTSPIAPALLTKMRAKLLQKVEKSETYHSGEEAVDSSLVQHGDVAHSNQDSHHVRNMSAAPIGAAPLQFQRAEQSEFQAEAHQAVLVQMPEAHMLTSAPQSPESTQAKTQDPTSHPNQLGPSATSANNSHGEESQTLTQNVKAKTGSEIAVKFRVDSVPNKTLNPKTEYIVNNSLVEAQTWIPAPDKEPETSHLFGRPFQSDPFVHDNASTANEADDIEMVKPQKLPASQKNASSSKEAPPFPPRTLYGQAAPGRNNSEEIKTETEDPHKLPTLPKNASSSKEAVPLPPRTLYGQPFANDSVALVDASTVVAQVSSLAEPQQVLLHGSSARMIQAPQGHFHPLTNVVPGPRKRNSVVRSSSPRSSATATVTESPGVTAMYFPGHWGRESPAILRQPKDNVRKEMDEPAMVLGILVTLAIIIVFVLLLFVAMPFKSLCPWPEGNDHQRKGEVRKWVESFRVSSAEDIEDTFKPRAGYDCLLLQPQNPGIAVRVQGVVVASQQDTLRAPITRRKCVLFSTSALERRLDGVVAPPQAFHSMAINFAIEVSPHFKLQIRGQDVALFDMAAGRHEEENVVLRDASDLVQDFVRAHRTPFFGARENDCLDFQECVLEVGAKVTCVGEVRRSENGELGLWPIHHDVPSEAVAVPPTSGLTSWERLGGPVSGESQIEKVMISDDAQLLR